MHVHYSTRAPRAQWSTLIWTLSFSTRLHDGIFYDALTVDHYIDILCSTGIDWHALHALLFVIDKSLRGRTTLTSQWIGRWCPDDCISKPRDRSNSVRLIRFSHSRGHWLVHFTVLYRSRRDSISITRVSHYLRLSMAPPSGLFWCCIWPVSCVNHVISEMGAVGDWLKVTALILQSYQFKCYFLSRSWLDSSFIPTLVLEIF